MTDTVGPSLTHTVSVTGEWPEDVPPKTTIIDYVDIYLSNGLNRVVPDGTKRSRWCVAGGYSGPVVHLTTGRPIFFEWNSSYFSFLTCFLAFRLLSHRRLRKCHRNAPGGKIWEFLRISQWTHFISAKELEPFFALKIDYVSIEFTHCTRIVRQPFDASSAQLLYLHSNFIVLWNIIANRPRLLFHPYHFYLIELILPISHAELFTQCTSLIVKCGHIFFHVFYVLNLFSRCFVSWMWKSTRTRLSSVKRQITPGCDKIRKVGSFGIKVE